MTELLSNPVTWINWFAPITITWLAKPIYKSLIQFAKNFTKKLQLSKLRKIKKNRMNPFLVHVQIAKSSSYFTLFLCSILFFYFALFSLPFITQAKSNNPLFIMYIIPVLFLEVLWLNQDSLTNDLIKSSSKLRSNPSFKRDA